MLNYITKLYYYIKYIFYYKNNNNKIHDIEMCNITNCIKNNIDYLEKLNNNKYELYTIYENEEK